MIVTCQDVKTANKLFNAFHTCLDMDINGRLTVYDVNAIINVPPERNNAENRNHGWTNLDDMCIIKLNEGCIIDFPVMIELAPIEPIFDIKEDANHE